MATAVFPILYALPEPHQFPSGEVDSIYLPLESGQNEIAPTKSVTEIIIRDF